MQIICPHCGFARDVPDDRVPATAKMATCPKCKQKFQFRDDAGHLIIPPPPRIDDLDAPGPAPTEDIRQESPDASPPPQAPRPGQPMPGEPVPGEPKDIWGTLEELHRPDTGGQGHGGQAEPESRVTRRWPPEGASGRGYPGRPDVAWEKPEKYGNLGGLVQTLKRILARPGDFFSEMPTSGGLSRPLLFYLILSEFQAICQYLWFIAGLVTPGMAADAPPPAAPAAPEGFSMASPLAIFLYPVIAAALAFVMSGLHHAGLTLLRANGARYEGTFRALCYASAPMVLAIVPVIGLPAGAVWSACLTVVAYKSVHRTTYARAGLAFLLPVLLAAGAAFAVAHFMGKA